jgi:hypothetical protein
MRAEERYGNLPIHPNRPFLFPHTVEPRFDGAFFVGSWYCLLSILSYLLLPRVQHALGTPADRRGFFVKKRPLQRTYGVRMSSSNAPFP